MMSLAEMFTKNNGNAVNINGSQVVMSYRIDVNTGQGRIYQK